MQTVRRAGVLLMLPAIGYLLAACDRTEAPTNPRLPPRALLLSNDPTTLWVNDDDPSGGGFVPPGTSCTHPGYEHVQDAVDDAGPGDRINVCPGTYTEQVTIPALRKTGIQLRSVGRWEAIIKAPSVMLAPKAIVRVNGAQGVTILAFTISGPGGIPAGCDALEYGVRVDDNGSADILGNHITQIRDEPFSGCQNGVAVQVGRWAEATTGSARIMGNVVDNYQKNGVTVDNAGSHAEIVSNRVLGVGPTTLIAQNGIQASRGATAEIRHNFVSGNVYSPGTVSSTGVLFYGSGAAVTEHNTLNANDVGAYMFDFVFENGSCGTAAGSTTAYNRARASSFDGIILSGFFPCFVTGVQVAHNRSDQNSGPGIGVYDAMDNVLDDNGVDNNRDSGILLDDGNNNTVGDNKVRNNGTADMDLTDGIRVNTNSTDNTIQTNHLKDNVTYDCHDGSVGTRTAMTANTWIGNHGDTENKPGLCTKDPTDDATFETSTGWDPGYPWYDSFGVAVDYDWATAYAAIDTESLLQLLPQIRLGGIRRAIVSPNE